MLKKIILLVVALQIICTNIFSQCSICTKTASQLGEGPAQGLNAAIFYLMITPLAIMLIVGYRWWQKEKMINN